MRIRRAVAVAFVILAVQSERLLSQDSTRPNSVALQSLIWLDSFFPKEIVAISGEYEHALIGKHSLLGRVTWFRDPKLTVSDFGVAGYGVAFEYRYYVSELHSGWHIGPFAELVRYSFVGASEAHYGPRIRSTFDVGVVAGHKWSSGGFIFDLSVRAAAYDPDAPQFGGYFPAEHQSRFNSHMIVSAGLTL
jgi:hypothetical protein